MSYRAEQEAEGASVQPFVYQPVANRLLDADSDPAPDPRNQAEAEAENRVLVEKARQEGFTEAERRLRADYEAKLVAQHSAVDSAVGEFARQRERYFERVEVEIVNLSLSIAQKILHREAQIDPLLLVGLVHVALDKLDRATQVRLRVNPEKMALWERHFRETTNGGPVPELVANGSVAPDGCVLETDVGTTAIGIETHLKEIEQGFFDLLAQRPR